MKVKGHELSSSAEGWQRLQPEVECGDDAMTLTVRRRRAVQLLLDPGETSFQFPHMFSNDDSGMVLCVKVLVPLLSIEVRR